MSFMGFQKIQKFKILQKIASLRQKLTETPYSLAVTPIFRIGYI
jgi:hypothetical protein